MLLSSPQVKTFTTLTKKYQSKIIDWNGCKQAKNVGRGITLGYLPPLGKSSALLGRVGWEVIGDQRLGMTSCKLNKYCTVSGRVPKVS